MAPSRQAGAAWADTKALAKARVEEAVMRLLEETRVEGAGMRWAGEGAREEEVWELCGEEEADTRGVPQSYNSAGEPTAPEQPALMRDSS